MLLQGGRFGGLLFCWRDGRDALLARGFAILHCRSLPESREHCGFRVGGLRDIDGFAPEELIAAMRYTLKDKRRGVKGAELIRTTSRDLGYKRTGGKIEEALRAALDLACKDGAIVCGFGYYRLPDGQK